MLEIKPSGIVLKAGERIVVETPGAGGYGPPEDRAPAALEEDRRSGKFGAAWLRERYGR
jgi:N-methylhydantoinase B